MKSELNSSLFFLFSNFSAHSTIMSARTPNSLPTISTGIILLSTYGHMANKQLLTTVLNTDSYLLIAIQISGVFIWEFAHKVKTVVILY